MIHGDLCDRHLFAIFKDIIFVCVNVICSLLVIIGDSPIRTSGKASQVINRMLCHPSLNLVIKLTWIMFAYEEYSIIVTFNKLWFLNLGLLYDHGHLSRAVCCRLSHGAPDITPALPQGYRINHPKLGRVTVCDPPREVQKTKEYSINWIEGDRNPEVLDGTKGICTGVRCVDLSPILVASLKLDRNFHAPNNFHSLTNTYFFICAAH